VKSKPRKKLRNLSLFNLEKLEVTGNRVKPGPLALKSKENEK
jgi:hypothetical protein